MQSIIRFNSYDVMCRGVSSRNIVSIRHYMWNLEGLYEQPTSDPDRTLTNIPRILFVFDGTLHLMEKNVNHLLMASCLRVREAIHIVHTKSVVFVKQQWKTQPSKAAGLTLDLTLGNVIMVAENYKVFLTLGWTLFHE